jgi:hypothetical protein
MRAALAVALLLLAGCAGHPAPVVSPATEAPAPSPGYTLTVRVSEEAPDGPPLAGVEVVAYPLDAAGQPGLGVGRATASDGAVRFAFPEPTRLALRASAPGWTREGGVVSVGSMVTSEGLLVSDRDAFLPLYRSSLRLTAASALMTATTLDASPALADLALPNAGYLARLSGADVAVRWDETPTQRADLAAGLAWDGQVVAHGDPSGLAAAPGGREATWSGDASPAGTRLSAAAVLNSAAVGDVPLSFEVTLRFSGREPAGLPRPCHSSEACVPLPPLPA